MYQIDYRRMKVLLPLALLTLSLTTSCFKRELEYEDNYVNIKQDPSLADNEVLRFRTFKLDDYDRYIIFGNNNEVSIEGSAQLPLLLYIDQLNRPATVDLSGCTYEYHSREDRLLFHGALLRSEVFSEPVVIEVGCTLKKKPESAQTRDRFTLRLRSFTLPEGREVTVEKRQIWQDKSIGMSIEPSYDLTYYRN